MTTRQVLGAVKAKCIECNEDCYPIDSKHGFPCHCCEAEELAELAEVTRK